jgi:hypothetical protein
MNINALKRRSVISTITLRYINYLIMINVFQTQHYHQLEDLDLNL